MGRCDSRRLKLLLSKNAVLKARCLQTWTPAWFAIHVITAALNRNTPDLDATLNSEACDFRIIYMCNLATQQLV